MKKIFSFLFLVLVAGATAAQVPAIIPQPVQLQPGKGFFLLNARTRIVAADEEDRRSAALFNLYLQEVYGFQLGIAEQGNVKNGIRLSTKKWIKAPDRDAYSLQVSANGVLIEGDTYAATFYGLQTLIQLLPAARVSTPFSLPCLSILDYPRFAYRGMHLDVCRHFFPPAFIRRYIDYLALHKMNYFHWHLTEDQGWRIEIRKSPRLTSVGAFRNGTIIGRYPGTGNDNIPYGGFYTQQEIKDIVQYAAARHITVMPEIEMPGHSSAAIAAYPWLSCFPGQKTDIPSHPSLASQKAAGKLVQETWGVFDDVYCAGSDSSFLFLQDVLDEVIALFPSTYIHVGGDECPKTNWQKCPRCQARMKALGLKDEHELQSYFIRRMEKYVNAKGRKLVGWDEILEGGLPSNAVVMSWRGEQGGIEAAKQGHQVIMTPEKPVYFDQAQSKDEDSLVIGGYNPLEQVYAYEPVPRALDSSGSAHVLGAQANVWTEYMTNGRKVEYMVLPRMSALAEVQWSPREKRSWGDFEKRLKVQFRRYDLWHANYSRTYFELQGTVLPAPDRNGVFWKLDRKDSAALVRVHFWSARNAIRTGAAGRKNGQPATPVLPAYALEDSMLYAGPVKIDTTGIYEAQVWEKSGGGMVAAGKKLRQAFHINKATGKNISIAKAPNGKYPGQPGAFSLVNGVYSNKGLSYPDWLGWIGDDLEAVIDLGRTQSFDSVRLHTLDQNGSWIYLPPSVTVWTSNDGKSFQQAGSSAAFVPDTLTMGWISVAVPKQRARFVRIIAKNYGTIPAGQPGAGNKAWLFADEVQVD